MEEMKSRSTNSKVNRHSLPHLACTGDEWKGVEGDGPHGEGHPGTLGNHTEDDLFRVILYVAIGIALLWGSVAAIKWFWIHS
jgi:hypothetical protein